MLTLVRKTNLKRKLILDERMKVKCFEDGLEIMHPLGASFLEVISNYCFAPVQQIQLSAVVDLRRCDACDCDECAPARDRRYI